MFNTDKSNNVRFEGIDMHYHNILNVLNDNGHYVTFLPLQGDFFAL